MARLFETPTPDGIEHVGVATLAGRDGALASRIRAAGVPVEPVGGGGPAAVWSRWRKLVAKCQPDILHAWLIHPATLLTVVPHGLPLVLGIHHSLDSLAGEKFRSIAIIRGLALLSRRADRICYVSQTSRCQHEGIGYPAAKGAVIPNGFLTHDIPAAPTGAQALREQLGIPDGGFLFGQLARSHPIKGHEVMLRAFAAVARARADVRLVLIGAGTDSCDGPIQSLAIELGIADRVHGLGERDDVPTLLSGLDCLVNPSWSEALPNAVAEGMLARLPTIATAVGDTELLLGDHGIAVRPGDIDGLTQTMIGLAGTPPRDRAALGQAGHDHIAGHFSREAMARRYAALYADIAAKRRPGALR